MRDIRATAPLRETGGLYKGRQTYVLEYDPLEDGAYDVAVVREDPSPDHGDHVQVGVCLASTGVVRLIPRNPPLEKWATKMLSGIARAST